MIEVRFTGADGSRMSVAANAGDRLLDVAQAAGQPLEGTCNGQLACATCHVRIGAADFALLLPASETEEDMLDLVANASRTSRLACQVRLDATWPSLDVTVPAHP